MKVFCLTVRISLHILPICLLRDLQINTACFTEIKTREDFLSIQKIKVILRSTFISLWTSLRIPNNRHEMKCWGKWVLNVTLSSGCSQVLHVAVFRVDLRTLSEDLIEKSHTSVSMDVLFAIWKLAESYKYWAEFGKIDTSELHAILNRDLGQESFPTEIMN